MTSPSPLILKLVSVILIYTRRKIMIDYVGEDSSKEPEIG